GFFADAGFAAVLVFAAAGFAAAVFVAAAGFTVFAGAFAAASLLSVFSLRAAGVFAEAAFDGVLTTSYSSSRFSGCTATIGAVMTSMATLGTACLVAPS